MPWHTVKDGKTKSKLKTVRACPIFLLEAVRDNTKTVELPHVNRVLLQPHWRRETDFLHPALVQNSS